MFNSEGNYHSCALDEGKIEKPERIMATLELESTLSITDIEENIRTLFEIYDENGVLKVIRIRLNTIKKEGR